MEKVVRVAMALNVGAAADVCKSEAVAGWGRRHFPALEGRLSRRHTVQPARAVALVLSWRRGSQSLC